MTFLFCVVFIVINVVFVECLSKEKDSSEIPFPAPSWTNLSTTWNYSGSSKYHFTPTGRTVKEAVKLGFVFKDDFCTDKNTRFRGHRYWIKDDPGIALLFDSRGTIAGIQTMVPKSPDYKPPAPLVNRAIVDDGDYWTLTAYFVDIDSICHKGRNKKVLKRKGTGDRLLLQNCADAVHPSINKNPVSRGRLPPEPFVNMPLTEEGLLATGLWTKGSCIRGMGYHYAYNITKTMALDEWFPMNPLILGGKLVGFFFQIFGLTARRSERYETQSNASFQLAVNPNVLDFVSQDSRAKVFQTLHVYFIQDPGVNIVC